MGRAADLVRALVTGAGGFVVVWRDDSGADGSSQGVFGQRYDASGNPVAAEFTINTTTSGTQDTPTIAATPDGGSMPK